VEGSLSHSPQERFSRLRKNCCSRRELRWSARVAPQENSGRRTERDGRGLIWFIWSVLFIWLVSCNQTNKTDQINKRDQPVLAFHAPPSVLLRWAMMSLASARGSVVKGAAC
jgi:hypothetical protein